MTEAERKARIKMRQESDSHIDVMEPDGTKIIDDGKITAYGKKLLAEEKK